MAELRIVPAGPADSSWLAQRWRATWGGESMVAGGRVHHLADLATIVARRGERSVGSATYLIDEGSCELVAIEAVETRRGIGTALLAAVEAAARAAGRDRLRLITTNDNLDALRFYQRRGYRIVAVHPGATDRARELKPAIPIVGAFGIPIHDELELEKQLV